MRKGYECLDINVHDEKVLADWEANDKEDYDKRMRQIKEKWINRRAGVSNTV